MIARSAMWCRSRRHQRLPRAGAPDHGAVPGAWSPSPAAVSRQAGLTQAARLGGRAAGRRRADLAAGQQGAATLPLPGPAGPSRWRGPRPSGSTPRRQAPARADDAGWELPTRWLLVEWPANKAEPVKYWLSNLP